MPRDSIASLATALLPLVLAALTWVAARVARAITAHIRDRRLALAVELAAYGAAGVVADLAQHVVGDLKDPTKPGTWTQAAAASIRQRAVERVRDLYPSAVRVIDAAAMDPARADELLGTLVERAVVELKGRSIPGALLLEASAPPDAGRPTTAPPAPDEGTAHRPDGAQGAA